VIQCNVAEAKARLSELIQKALLGEEVVIARDNRPLARLTPIARTPGDRTPGSAKGQVRIADDFDETPKDFEDYR
jgi:prevent-host-death family protein